MKRSFIAAISVLCFAACKKSSSADETKPVISITSPMANQQFNAGAAVNIKATITDNNELHSVHLIVINKTTNYEVIHFMDHTDTKTYQLDKSFIAAAATTYMIQVSAEDHSANFGQMEFEVKGK